MGLRTRAGRPTSDTSLNALLERLQDEENRRFLLALRGLLETVPGRYVLGETIGNTVDGSILDQSGSMMYYKEGRRVVGIELQEACSNADPENAMLMLAERRQRIVDRDRLIREETAAAEKRRKGADS